jgi:hypothetical protein
MGKNIKHEAGNERDFDKFSKEGNCKKNPSLIYFYTYMR